MRAGFLSTTTTLEDVHHVGELRRYGREAGNLEGPGGRLQSYPVATKDFEEYGEFKAKPNGCPGASHRKRKSAFLKLCVPLEDRAFKKDEWKPYRAIRSIAADTAAFNGTIHGNAMATSLSGPDVVGLGTDSKDSEEDEEGVEGWDLHQICSILGSSTEDLARIQRAFISQRPLIDSLFLYGTQFMRPSRVKTAYLRLVRRRPRYEIFYPGAALS
ncbi:hypothetical protein K438DRAFT_1766336 [Mycena galopus ATCC 62051]|nr:hypothetical protein K438DRAFT_1766336 [Mycena galopus ATCC 62051]